ncbi:phage minor tail family protein [Moraxella catarrhalis]|uniref:Phage minor tail family protein n=2 Tax=Moraxella catarrhalis TaxID=480 RepID=A0ABY0BLP2_MORCA|nr:phage minor tail family protein [Moraxella catarrhalis]RUO17419.1 phage minor tail family protein [Moraxella catarrhalis]
MGASASVHHAVSKTQFGDGYAQRVSLGINNQRTDWSGSKTGDWQTVILPIKTFLDEHKGVIPFLWTNPHGQTKNMSVKIMKSVRKKATFGRSVLSLSNQTQTVAVCRCLTSVIKTAAQARQICRSLH